MYVRLLKTETEFRREDWKFKFFFVIIRTIGTYSIYQLLPQIFGFR